MASTVGHCLYRRLTATVTDYRTLETKRKRKNQRSLVSADARTSVPVTLAAHVCSTPKQGHYVRCTGNKLLLHVHRVCVKGFSRSSHRERLGSVTTNLSKQALESVRKTLRSAGQDRSSQRAEEQLRLAYQDEQLGRPLQDEFVQ